MIHPSWRPSPARERRLLVLLRAHPGGVDEYRLIKTLQAGPARALPEGALSDALILFRCHCLLHNALYRLCDRLRRWRVADLEIGPLQTRLLPYRAGRAALGAPDPLRAVYLDLERLQHATTEDIEELLRLFWRRYYAADDRARALRTLGFEREPEDYRALKRRYRRLAMRHHPDRGGDPDTLRIINGAMRALEGYYRP